MKLAAIAAVVIALTLTSCSPDSWDRAPAPTKDRPCGFGVVCITQHGCCWQGSTCGGEPESVGCPPSTCCAIGNVGAERGDAGVYSTPMRPMQEAQ